MSEHNRITALMAQELAAEWADLGRREGFDLFRLTCQYRAAKWARVARIAMGMPE